MSVQTPMRCATLRSMTDRHGRANLEQIRMLMEEMEAQLDRDWPHVPVERATEADPDVEPAGAVKFRVVGETNGSPYEL
ncbi:hypothetical protein [Deinococcus caeni]|uniref:hypothetical protein n=1 Tax=Deinococcus caeni TaxID=569127 RepID=UPI0031E6E620